MTASVPRALPAQGTTQEAVLGVDSGSPSSLLIHYPLVVGKWGGRHDGTRGTTAGALLG